MASLLDFGNLFGEINLKNDEEKVEKKREETNEDGVKIVHTKNVVITDGTYKGYYGWVKDIIPKKYYIELDKSEIDSKGMIIKINNLDEYANYMHERRLIREYKKVNNEIKNRGVSFMGDNYYIFDKNDIENFDNEKYKTWNWNIRGNYFDKKLKESEKEERDELEFGSFDVGKLSIKDNDKEIENSVLVSNKNQEYKLGEVKIVIFQNKNLYELVKITGDKRVLVRRYDISYDYEKENKMGKNNEVKETLNSKIKDIKDEIDRLNEEKNDILKKIQSYDKIKLQKDIILLESKMGIVMDEVESDKLEMRINYLKELIAMKKITTNELEGLNKRLTVINEEIYKKNVKINEYKDEIEKISELLISNVITNEMVEEYMLGNLSIMVKEKNIKYKEDAVYLDIESKMKLYSIVRKDVGIGMYDQLKLIDIVYGDRKKLIAVADNMMDKSSMKKIGGKVKITKGLYRNEVGSIKEIIQSRLYIYIDAINRLVSTHIKKNKETFITPYDVIYLDILDKDNVYHQVIGIENEEQIDLKRLDYTGIIKREDYKKIGIKNFRAKSNKGISKVDINNISRYNSGFEVSYKLKRQDKKENEKQEYIDKIVEEVEEVGEEEEEEGMDYSNGEDEEDEEEGENLEYEEEPQYKMSFKEMEQRKIVMKDMTKSEKDILEIIRKLNKIEDIVEDEYMYIKEIENIVKKLQEKEKEVKISKKEIVYIVFMVSVYHSDKSDMINIKELIDKLLNKKYFNKTQFKNNIFLKGKNAAKIADIDNINNIVENVNKFLEEEFNMKVILDKMISTDKPKLIKTQEPRRKIYIIDYIFNRNIIEKYMKLCDEYLEKSININSETKKSIILIKQNLWNLPGYFYKIKMFTRAVNINMDELKAIIGEFISKDMEENKTLMRILGIRTYNFLEKMYNDIINQNLEEYMKIIEYGDYFYIIEMYNKEFAKKYEEVLTKKEYRLLYNNFIRLPFYIREMDDKSEIYKIAKEYLIKIIYKISIERKTEKKRKVTIRDEEEIITPIKISKFKKIKSQEEGDNIQTNPLVEAIRYGSRIDETLINRFLNTSVIGLEPIAHAIIHSNPDIIGKILDYEPFISTSTLMIAIQSLSKASIKTKILAEIANRIKTEISEEKEEEYQVIKDLIYKGILDNVEDQREIVKKYKNVYNELLREYSNKMKNIVDRIIELVDNNRINTMINKELPLTYAIRFAPIEIVVKILELTSDENRKLAIVQDLVNRNPDGYEYINDKDLAIIKEISK